MERRTVHDLSFVSTAVGSVQIGCQRLNQMTRFLMHQTGEANNSSSQQSPLSDGVRRCSMLNTLEEVLERNELREVLNLEQQDAEKSATIAQWFGAALRTVSQSFNALTARQARRYQIRAYLFG